MMLMRWITRPTTRFTSLLLLPLLAALLAGGVSSCKKDTTAVEDTAALEAQKKVDDAAITAYVAAKSLTATRTASGLYYVKVDMATPTAAQPTAGKTVVVNYYGRLLTGTTEGKKFDSSYDRSQPFEFKLGAGQVIRGWDEAVAQMRVGDAWRVIIPSYLAYGTSTAGAIPPNSVLIFYIKLERIK